MTTDAEHHRVAIIGAGLSGIGLAVRLLEQGIHDFVICERNDNVGGVWTDHTYPGCAVDVPAHLYSYSFKRNPGWSRMYPQRREILDYIRGVADEFGVRPYVRTGCEMLESAWDDAACHWRLSTSRGELTADVLVVAIGGFSEPLEPTEIPGWDSFKGRRFHSARWDHDHELEGKRVAVIGTGSAAAQFIPAIQPKVAELTVFQRTPPWVLPHRDREVSEREKQILRMLPFAQDLQRNLLFGTLELMGIVFRGQTWPLDSLEAKCREHLENQVPDPVLRAKLTPNYRLGCKRPIPSNTYLPSLTQPNVEVITERVAKVTPKTIVTDDGTRRTVDTIIAATGYGFIQSKLFGRIKGVGGTSLIESWNGEPRAYLGATRPGFPNMFQIHGPNSVPVTSIFFASECQIAYIVDAVRTMARQRLARIDVHQAALDEYVADCDRRHAGSVWTDGGCRSYYLDGNGRNIAAFPDFATNFRRRTRRFDLERYDARTAA